jgi:hypothetical protein
MPEFHGRFRSQKDEICGEINEEKNKYFILIQTN